MRIGIFTDSYEPIISGVTVSINVLEKELVKLGHEVYIITSEHDDAIPRENVVRVPGVRLPMKGLKEYRIGKVTRRRVKEIAKYDFDVIHCHTEFTIGRIGRCIAKKYNIPLVHTYHTMYEEYVHFVSKTFARSLRFLSKKYFKSFANSADVVIFPTKKVKDRFKEYGYQKEGRIVPTGIYLEKFRKINFSTNELNQLKDTLGIEENDFVLMFLGRVSREKSLGDLITNFKTIVQPNIKLLIVGGGPDEDHFKKMVSDLDLKDNVIFTGMVSQVDVPMYYHLGNLFGNFSMTETQGLTYCEALASSLPLLVKYDKNLDGVIENGVNGYTFNTNEEFEMTFNMIYKNPIMYNELKTKASLNIQQFSAQTYGKKVLEIYQDLIGKK
jgi:1,2-diacylglycerol 3-alpha-glucosyltransferase